MAVPGLFGERAWSGVVRIILSIHLPDLFGLLQHYLPISDASAGQQRRHLLDLLDLLQLLVPTYLATSL